MKSQRPASTRASVLSLEEWRALHALRAQYQQNPDLWSAQELARLRFLRWLYQTGQLAP